MQRALRLKARREARLRTQSTPHRVEVSIPLDVDSLSSTGSSQSNAIPNPLLTSRPARIPGDSEIDFSPSVGVAPFKAVPTSLDGGSTLDWSGTPVEEVRDRRWSLSRSKRKSREQIYLTSDRVNLEGEYASKCRPHYPVAVSYT